MDASKLADRTTVYTHRDPEKVIAAWAGKRIHQLTGVTLSSAVHVHRLG